MFWKGAGRPTIHGLVRVAAERGLLLGRRARLRLRDLVRRRALRLFLLRRRRRQGRGSCRRGVRRDYAAEQGALAGPDVGRLLVVR